MRLRNKPWAAEKIANSPNIVPPNPSEYRGEWAAYFNHNGPIHVEVGTGKGKFLTEMAQAYPDVCFIGIEKFDSVIVSAIERAEKANLPNLVFLNEDVQELRSFFAEGEIDQLYLNFSDPWPKVRHAKRRLTHEGFLSMYQEVLKPKGEVHFKTDNQGLFEYSLESFSKYGLKLQNISLDLHNSDISFNVMTEYEEKFSERGNRIYRCEASFPS
ncbi:tRNA (guanosine(46)-N7)-methyltransferase TrmB [Texcoconibacillus texcoconensis]|uniref:tRNA (guanine-N(7)-)-methyltransferase n=1 Tax=Texcoconibacillus texcoconensis TaxID=1095777 RepID=A0A840QN42_9BACI|nr:tRNA (guanosine(46)-N7)-methyltransferase TrmB [Texcoconibacillus texcoconensis]MBB5172794.1 tRNA (guanine-N7-)-methyltransferase [Texcoconibacillus texcoconensis]